MRFAGWRINPHDARELHDPAGVRITLTGAEFDLLVERSAATRDRCCRARQLIEQAFGGLIASVERSVDVHISRIRQKIEPDPKDRSMIKTVQLGGYLFTPVVEN